MLKVEDLPPVLREQLIANGLVEKTGKIKRAGKILSPYAETLGAALESRYPARMLREYRPLTGRKYRIDFAFPNERLAIEFDGYRCHGFSRKGFRDGLKRQNLLTGQGWRFLRFTITDVRDSLADVLADVDHALQDKATFIQQGHPGTDGAV